VTEERNPEQNCFFFDGEITCEKNANPKIALGSIPSEDVGFNNYI
jgi:hypothetical protein